MDRERPRGGFTLVELLIVIVIIGILASLLIPAIIEALRQANEVKCLNNLREIGNLMETYRKDYGCPDFTLPIETGRAFHDRLRATVGVGSEKLWECPLEGSNDDGLIDYRGPFANINRAANFKVDDPIAGDEPANHGDPDRYGVQFLTKGHQAIKITTNNAVIWTKYLDKTAP